MDVGVLIGKERGGTYDRQKGGEDEELGVERPHMESGLELCG